MSQGGDTSCARSGRRSARARSTTGSTASAMKTGFDVPEGRLELVLEPPARGGRRGQVGARRGRRVEVERRWRRDRDRLPFQWLAVDTEVGRGPSPRLRPIRVNVVGTCGTARGDDRVEVRAVGERQAVGVVGRAGVDDVVHLDDVAAVGRQGQVEERVGPFHIAALGDLPAARVEDAERGVEPAVEPLGCQVEEDAPAFLPLEGEAIDVGRGDLAVDDRVHRDRVRLGGDVVRLDLDGLGPVAHDERARVAHPERPDRADVVVADRRPGRAGDAEGQPLEVDGAQAGVVEPERLDSVEVGPAQREVDRLARGRSPGARGWSDRGWGSCARAAVGTKHPPARSPGRATTRLGRVASSTEASGGGIGAVGPTVARCGGHQITFSSCEDTGSSCPCLLQPQQTSLAHGPKSVPSRPTGRLSGLAVSGWASTRSGRSSISAHEPPLYHKFRVPHRRLRGQVRDRHGPTPCPRRCRHHTEENTSDKRLIGPRSALHYHTSRTWNSGVVPRASMP